MSKATPLLLLLAVCVISLHCRQASAIVYKVTPAAQSSDGNDGVYSLLDALDRAKGGDTIELEDGTYTDQIHSTGPGQEGNPITIIGSRNAVVKATNPCVEITHSWITLEGFSVDGKTGSTDEKDSYENKCVNVDGDATSEEDALDGFIMRDMHVQNCGGECVRLKNFVVNAEITGNTINDCGVHDFVFGSDPDDKNGEGIYIGTSIKQWADYGEDRCNNNVISWNTIETNGNECVEAKEGSSGNRIEHNVCSNQDDSESGCYCSRGDENTIRYNDASDCRGAGVRLGGGVDEDTNYQYGRMNNVYGNSFVRAVEAAITVRVVPQGEICGNSCEDGPCDIETDEDLDTDSLERTWNAPCTSPVPSTNSPVDDSPAPVGSTPSPEVKTPAPTIDTPSPTVGTPAPVGRTPTPGVETPSPTISTPSPTVETSSPVGSTPSPDVETPSPTISTPSPTTGTSSPIGSTPSPEVETPAPTIGTTSPTVESPSPVGGTPSPEVETPAPTIGTPSPPEKTPSPVRIIPSSDVETPAPTISTPSPTVDTSSPVDRTRTPEVETPSPTIITLSPSFDTPSPTGAIPGNDDEDDSYHVDDDDFEGNDSERDDDGGNNDYESDDDENGDDDGNDDYESDDDNGDDDGNDDYESDDDVSRDDDAVDDYMSDDDDTDDYMSDDDDSGDDDSGDDDSGDDDSGDDDGGDDDNDGDGDDDDDDTQ